MLKLMPEYLVTWQRYLIIACCVIHNFVLTITLDDKAFVAFDNPDDYSRMNVEHNTNRQFHKPNMSNAVAQATTATSDGIALPMWMHAIGQ